jgi:purine-binding chemotaxis protein CheW
VSDARFASRAAEMRHAFDRSFAGPEAERRDDSEALLTVRVAGTRYAFQLPELAGLFVDRTIMPMPSSARGLVGLVGIRGAVVPVYALGELLGHSPSAQSTRWLVLARASAVAFAFDEFDGHVSVPRAHIVPAGGADALRTHVHALVHLGDAVHPIVDLSHLIETLGRS